MPKKTPDDPQESLAEVPSTVFSFWAEREAPIEEEIRLALDASFPGIELVEELDAEEGMLWGSVYRLPEHESEFVVWVQDRADVPDPFVEDAISDPSERALAGAARWFIGV